ncbi:MAG: SMP-30/gluconolactonase/LRE family protein [Candidatus Rokubacteria bacterium]|nr:SMP-30/gluconolactonase/LRE family protein [Candidatus Rokubacteria bacterium]
MFLVVVALLMVSIAWSEASADGVTRFADIPSPGQGEGISVAPNGQVVVGTFTFEGPSHVFVFDKDGQLIRDVPIADVVPAPLLGVIWKGQDIFAADFVNGRILRIAPDDQVSVFAVLPDLRRVPKGPKDQPPAPNGLALDRDGNLYVSDSFQGVIWKITESGQVSVWKQDIGLISTQALPFGANGITFTPLGDALLAANSGEGTIVKIPVNPDGSAGPVSTFAAGITVPDGIAFGPDGNLWVVSPASPDYAVLVWSPTGELLASVGTEGFNGPTSIDFLHGPEGITMLAPNLGFFTGVPDFYIAALSVREVPTWPPTGGVPLQ